MSDNRSAVLPDLPTAREQGVHGVDADGWNGFFFPKGAPAPAVAKLAAATDKVLDTPSIRERIVGLGLDIPAREQRGPDYLAKWVRIELDKWGPPIKAAGISVD
jgi:tripartite-type tricarboxylate transporter receptor subunit TctC